MNPVMKIVREARLSLQNFAVLHGVSLSSLRNTVYDNVDKIPKRLGEILKTLGYDLEELQKEYRAWLATKCRANRKGSDSNE